ncbi:MAG: inositol 2-dehydrogenase [Anaerolineae bacterium]|nr:inositol 2-dehydrogenase [Anaerolineae bacterium]
MVRVGIIGAGRIGQVHAENLAYRIPEAEVVAIADIDERAAAACAARFGVPAATDNPHAILDNPAIDAVLICSPTETHAMLMEAAAAANKHIFCEKPIALNLAAIDHALAAVEEAGVKLQIGFNRRFDPNFRHVREMVAAGKIGEPHILRITSRDPAPPPVSYIKASGGIFLDMTIHDFDMARYLIGSEVAEVFAAGGVRVDPAIGEAGDIDTALVTLRFENGAIGAIDNCRKAVYGYDQRVEVFGADGSIAVANNTPHNAVHSDAEGVHGAKPLYFFMQRYTESFIEEMRAFIAAIVNDTPTPVTGQDGRVPVVMGLAAWKSYKENRPVPLSEIG